MGGTEVARMDIRGVIMGTVLIGTMVVYMVPVLWAVSRLR